MRQVLPAPLNVLLDIDFCTHTLETETTSTGALLFHDGVVIHDFPQAQLDDLSFDVWPIVQQKIKDAHGIHRDPATIAIEVLEQIIALDSSPSSTQLDRRTAINDLARKAIYALRSWRRERFEPLGDPKTLDPTVSSTVPIFPHNLDPAAPAEPLPSFLRPNRRVIE